MNRTLGAYFFWKSRDVEYQAAKLLTKDEARRIAANVAKLLALLAILTAAGATSLALIAVADQHPAPALATSHLLKLQDELALP